MFERFLAQNPGYTNTLIEFWTSSKNGSSFAYYVVFSKNYNMQANYSSAENNRSTPLDYKSMTRAALCLGD